MPTRLRTHASGRTGRPPRTVTARQQEALDHLAAALVARNEAADRFVQAFEDAVNLGAEPRDLIERTGRSTSWVYKMRAEIISEVGPSDDSGGETAAALTTLASRAARLDTAELGYFAAMKVAAESGVALERVAEAAGMTRHAVYNARARDWKPTSGQSA